LNEFLIYSLIVFGVLLLILQFIVIHRKHKVVEFRIYLINLCYQKDKMNNSLNPNLWNDLQKKIPSQDKMIFSFKKLTLENWLTPEDIKKIKL